MPDIVREAMVRVGFRAILANTGSTIVYTPAIGSPVSVQATAEAGDPQSQAPGLYLVFGCLASDFPEAPIRGGAVTWNGNSYRIRDVDADIYRDWLRLSVEKT